MQPTHKIEKEVDKQPKKQPLRGGKTLLYYTNEQFLDDTNENTSFLYITV